MGDEGNNNSNNNAQNPTGQNNNTNQTSGNVDYSKIQQMIDGRNARTEESVLKAYFQKQGLSAEEMESAIQNFKVSQAEKAKAEAQNAINLQSENATLKAKVQEMEVNQKANQAALELGVDVKTIPYLLKMADLSNAIDSDGKISDENIKTALNTVLEALPQLKPQTTENNKGFQKIGGENNNQKTDVDDALNKIFGL